MTAQLLERAVEPERNALEAFLLGFCLLTGLSGILSPIPDNVPTFINIMWNTLIIFGGMVGIAGVVWKNRLTGMLILRSALIPLGLGAYGYIPFVGEVGGPYAIVIVLTFGICAHIRVWQITKKLRNAVGGGRKYLG